MINMNINTHHLSLNVKKNCGLVFILSPLMILLFGAFNIGDTKWMLSRVIPIVFIYTLIFNKEIIIENIKKPELRTFYILSGILFSYYLLTHFIRGDEFGPGRTLMFSMIYILCLPWQAISKNYLSILFILAGIACGMNAIYEYYILHIPRVGIATNPIPYALFCAVLSLINLNTVLSNTYHLLLRLFAIIGGILPLISLILTDVRGVILFYPLVIVYLIARKVQNKTKFGLIFASFVIFTATLTYTLFSEQISNRLKITQHELHTISQGNYNTSIGIRLVLWKQGGQLPAKDVLFGLGEHENLKNIQNLDISGARVQPHRHNQYIEQYSIYGIIGLLLFSIWIMSPFIQINGTSNQGNQLKLVFPALASAILFIFLLAGLTDVPFHHTHLVYFYVITISMVLMNLERYKQ